MSEYNDLFDLDDPLLSLDAVDSEYPALPPDLDQSTACTAPLQFSADLIGGGTAAQQQLDLDSASPVVVEPLSLSHSMANHTCAVCLARYQTDSALHEHAIQAQHQAYRCKCGTDFNKHSALKRHIDTQHTPNIFACVLCDNKFTRKDKLREHWHHFHKVSVEGLRFLSDSQELKPREGAPSRRRRAPARKAAASSGTLAPALSRTHAPAGVSVWPFASSIGAQYTGLSMGQSVSTGLPAATNAFPLDRTYVTTTQFAASADASAAAPALDEDFPTTLDDFFADEAWAASLDGFNPENFPF